MVVFGSYDDAFYETIVDDWDVEVCVVVYFDELGLGGLQFDCWLGSFSGGEVIRVMLVGCMLLRLDLLLLDESINHIDLGARTVFYVVIECWKGGLFVVSHDRSLLDRVDQIVEFFF